MTRQDRMLSAGLCCFATGMVIGLVAVLGQEDQLRMILAAYTAGLVGGLATGVTLCLAMMAEGRRR